MPTRKVPLPSIVSAGPAGAVSAGGVVTAGGAVTVAVTVTVTVGAGGADGTGGAGAVTVAATVCVTAGCGTGPAPVTVPEPLEQAVNPASSPAAVTIVMVRVRKVPPGTCGR
ncbi:hypothetical protein GCM10009639_38650 [Kitasatospora putterlickiae]|uniref:Uncharacterized protein n=1 Tax=Kitasatospora putterlickiae TaxID=221725 RepID=A0ABN1Y6J0_9ACTN